MTLQLLQIRGRSYKHSSKRLRVQVEVCSWLSVLRLLPRGVLDQCSVTMSGLAPRRRLQGKQVAPPAYAAAAWEAVRAEEAAADGLACLPDGKRRRRIHYTHSRTHNPKDVQPSQRH